MANRYVGRAWKATLHFQAVSAVESELPLQGNVQPHAFCLRWWKIAINIVNGKNPCMGQVCLPLPPTLSRKKGATERAGKGSKTLPFPEDAHLRHLCSRTGGGRVDEGRPQGQKWMDDQDKDQIPAFNLGVNGVWSQAGPPPRLSCFSARKQRISATLASEPSTFHSLWDLKKWPQNAR